MLKFLITIFALGVLPCAGSYGQTDDGKEIKQWLLTEIAALADTSMHGRGYVHNGREKASAYLQDKFLTYGLKTVARKRTYTQTYTFPVNTFPGKMMLCINGDTLIAGKDYIVDASSPAFARKKIALQTIDLAKVKSTTDWEKILASLKNKKVVYYLKNIDDAIKVADINKHQLADILPMGCYLISHKEKFIWTVSGDVNAATVFYVKDEAITADSGTVSVNVEAVLTPETKNENIIGYVPGIVEDSFIVVTAHYDHLGMMGDNAIFPGASDNASGTAMLLYLAHYYASHPQRYSMLFIAFSGEEAGLKGSAYFTRQPVVMLGRIKFLTNIDIMGDATDGITVVNATEYPEQFGMLQKINKEHKYLTQIKSRGKAANSDHYHFSEAGVPSFFIYSNGGKGHYHDIFDTADELSMEKVDKVAQLLTDFIDRLQ